MATDAFCHGSEIRQFHGIRVQDSRGPGIAEDPTQDSYTLGMFSSKNAQESGLMNTKKARTLGSLREILESEDKESVYGLNIYDGSEIEEEEAVSDQKRYLVQSWAGGTMCDKTGVERRVEVQVSSKCGSDTTWSDPYFQFHCNSQASDRIFLIRETAICEYVMVVHTPRLCGEPIFVGSASTEDQAASEKRKKTPANIECRPVLPDYAKGLQRGPQHGEPRGLPESVPMHRLHTAHAEATMSSVTSSTSVALDPPAAQATEDTESRSKPQDRDTGGPDPPQATDQEDHVLDSFVLVVDPVTGEVVIQSENGASSVEKALEDVSLNTHPNEGADETVQRIMNMLHKSIETIFGEDVVKNVKEAVEAAKVADANLEEQEKHDPLSRLNQNGALRHKAIAEQFVRAQLKQGQHGGAAGNGDVQRTVADASPFGSSQHQALKREFGKKWKEENAENGDVEESERIRDEL